MHKDVSKGEQKVARKIIKVALTKGYDLTIFNGGDTSEISRATDFESAWAVMGESGEDVIQFRNVNGDRLGMVRLIYGNDPDELVNDYSTSLEEFMKECGQ